MRFSISSLLALAVAATTVAAQPAKRALSSINPPHSRNKHVDLTALPPVDTTPITNAKRFAQGLPPRRPHRGGPHRDGGHPYGGTRVRSAPRAETSSSPQANVKCNILVKTTGGSSLGYISPAFNDFGEYGTPQLSQAGALEVSFSGSSTSQISPVATSAPDAINSFPYLSATVGYGSVGDDLGPNSANYVYITGNSGPTDPGSLPSSSTSNSYSTRTSEAANSETAVWTYDPTTQNLQVMWVNTDGTSVPTTLIYAIDTETKNGGGNTLVATAGLDAFQELFQCTPDTCHQVTFTCVPPA